MSALSPSPDAVADLAARFGRAVAAVSGDAGAAEVQKKIFSNARVLGRGFVRTYGLVLEQDDLPGVLSALPTPCSQRSIERTESSVRLLSGGCSAASECARWREAFDGLVLGLSEDEVSFRRHRSVGAGDGGCADVLFATACEARELRYGAIPPELDIALAQMKTRLSVIPGIDVDVLGCSERIIFYTAKARSSEIATGDVVARAIARACPGYSAKDAAPAAVFKTEQ